MQETHASLVRPIGPRDHLRLPQLAAISSCLAALRDQAGDAGGQNPTLDDLVVALGDQAPAVTIAHARDDGFFYDHFGDELIADAGFDMTGRSTSEFETTTRHHIEQSYNQVLQEGIALCTIMPSAPGSHVNSWQRVVFPVDLDTGKHLVTIVKSQNSALESIQARRGNLAVCVVPLKRDEQSGAFVLATKDTLEDYLGASDFSPIDDFVAGISIGDAPAAIGTLLQTASLNLQTHAGTTRSLIMDAVHGFTTPFLVVIDATASALTNTDLRHTAHLLRAGSKLGQLGAWIMKDRHDDKVYISQELSTLLLIELDGDGSMPLSAFRETYSDAFRSEIEKSVLACWETGQSYEVEGAIHRSDGAHVEICVSGMPMRDQSGRIISLFGIVQDITERQAAKRQLEESEERFRDFAGSAGDWCWETDADHRFIEFTGGDRKFGQHAQSSFVGKTRREFPIADEDRHIIETHFKDLEARVEFKDLVYRIPDPEDTGFITVEIDGKPRFDAEGTFLGYRGTGRNISEKVAAAREREEHRLTLANAQSIAGLGHWITDLDSGTTRWSDNLLTLLGLERSAQDNANAQDNPAVFTVRQILEKTHQDDRRNFIGALRRASSDGSTAPVDIRYFKDDPDTPTHFRIQIRREAETINSPAKLIGVAQDMSDLKSVQSELETRTAMLNEAQAMGGIGDWQYDLKTKKLVWSDHLCGLLGFDPEGFTPTTKTIHDICPAEDAKAIQTSHQTVLKDGSDSRLDVQARRGDGTVGYYSLVTKPQRNSYGDVIGMFGTVQDITDRKHAEKQLRRLAFFDPLTGLGNRALFTRELRDILRAVRTKGGSAALFILDLDHFKEVNDTLGHAAGDELLVRVAAALREQNNRRGFVARLGGDEFAVIIRNYQSVECLKRFADSMVNKLTGVLRLERGEVQTGTSLGIALIPQDGGTTEEVLRNADLALYMAKDEGRGKALFFEPEMSRTVQARLNLARDLRKAVEDDGLETRFQGQVSLSTGKVTGFETLVRWKHPTKGYISPAEFIPVAESSSLICDIGLWVLRDACKTGRAWLDAGEPERMISVNVSAAQIWQTDFEDDVLSIIEETGYPPHLLCLELTESVFADHGEGRVRVALARFKEAGIELALDDFGTGYSSLGYLNELPFDELKIDRCFIAQAHNADDKARLLQGIIALGKGLGMRVVGEGAEDDGEIAILRECGCDIVQGFAFMRPEIADEALRQADALEFRLAESSALFAAQSDIKLTG